MSKHDRVAQRLAIILEKLNNGERLNIDELSQEFNVTKRTIQRDLFDRLSFLPLKKDNNYYFLEEYYLGKLNFNDIKTFAFLSGIRNLYPELSKDFLKKLLDGTIASAYMIRGCKNEDISDKKDSFLKIQDAILKNKIIEFDYRQKHRIIKPYKLTNFNGFWYLIGIEDKIKTFMFSKIKNLKITDKNFQKDKNIEEKIKNEDDIFFDKNMIEVLLEINKEIAHYFKVNKLLPYQEILKETNELLIVSSKVAYDEVILSIVRYWIPNIKILSPKWMNEKLKEELKKYIGTI